MESGASTDGDLDVVVEQLEMLAQRTKKKNGEVQEIQKENERMAKQLVNQVEKVVYEESQRIFKKEM